MGHSLIFVGTGIKFVQGFNVKGNDNNLPTITKSKNRYKWLFLIILSRQA
jgi:hypothetical protein